MTINSKTTENLNTNKNRYCIDNTSKTISRYTFDAENEKYKETHHKVYDVSIYRVNEEDRILRIAVFESEDQSNEMYKKCVEYCNENKRIPALKVFKEMAESCIK